jgi:Carboxypeptidase regulatory-like domain
MLTTMRSLCVAILVTAGGATACAADTYTPAVAKKQTPPAAVDKPGEPVVQLRGTVLAADGSPAAGATVWAAKVTLTPLVRRETSADAQGRYTLDLDPGKWVVWARRGTQGGQGPLGYVAGGELVAGRTPEPVEIRMEERGKFHGRLLEAETGKPVAGGKLFLNAGLVLTTDAEGRFEVGGLSREGHEAVVVAPGRMRMAVQFDTTARADAELDMTVPRGGKIIGRVTDMDGKPIPGAYVGTSASSSYWSMNGGYTACDAEGRFDYDGVPLNHAIQLKAAAPGYVEEQSGGLLVSSDKPVEARFQLRPQPADPKPGAAPAPQLPGDETRRTVSGVVRGPDKKPVEGVLVRRGFANTFVAIQARTNAEGRFRLIVPAKENLLAVLPRDYTPEFPSIAANGDQTIEIALQQGHTVHGLVLDDNHNPIQNVLAAATVPSPDPQIHGNDWLIEAAVYTDAAGRFTLKGVPDGAKFDFMKSGMNTIQDYELTLEGADKAPAVTMLYGGAVSGKVVDQGGKPIRNFRILVNIPREHKPGDVSGRFFMGFAYTGVRFTSEDGGFVLTGVNAGSVLRITAIAEGHSQAFVDRVTAVPLNHLADAKPLTLRTGPPVVLRVRAVTTDGKAIAGARVTLIDGDPALDQPILWGAIEGREQDMARARTDADGWAGFPALSFSAATLLVQAPGYARHSEGWRDGQKELTAKLAAEAVLTGEVHDAAGAPVKSYSFVLLSRDDQIWSAVGPEDKGRFRVAELPAGPWTLIIYTADKRSSLHNEGVTLQAGETKELNIEAKKK